MQPESDKEGFNLIEHLKRMQAETEAFAEYQVDLRKQLQFAERQALELCQKMVEEKCDVDCDG